MGILTYLKKDVFKEKDGILEKFIANSQEDHEPIVQKVRTIEGKEQERRKTAGLEKKSVQSMEDAKSVEFQRKRWQQNRQLLSTDKNTKEDRKVYTDLVGKAVYKDTKSKEEVKKIVDHMLEMSAPELIDYYQVLDQEEAKVRDILNSKMIFAECLNREIMTKRDTGELSREEEDALIEERTRSHQEQREPYTPEYKKAVLDDLVYEDMERRIRHEKPRLYPERFSAFQSERVLRADLRSQQSETEMENFCRTEVEKETKKNVTEQEKKLPSRRRR